MNCECVIYAYTLFACTHTHISALSERDRNYKYNSRAATRGVRASRTIKNVGRLASRSHFLQLCVFCKFLHALYRLPDCTIVFPQASVSAEIFNFLHVDRRMVTVYVSCLLQQLNPLVGDHSKFASMFHEIDLLLTKTRGNALIIFVFHASEMKRLTRIMF